MALVHFLLVYDHELQRLVARSEFASGNAAAQAYAEMEAAHRQDRNLEIVLVGADSLDTIMRTHGHYFDSSETAFPELAAVR